MLEGLQGYATPVLLTAGTLWFLARVFGETKRLEHIPSLGFSDPILSYWSALELHFDADGFMRRNWPKIKPGTKFVRIPGLIRWYVAGVGLEQFQDLTRAPDSILSNGEALEVYLHAKFTLHNDEIGDQIQVPAIQSNFTRSLNFLVPEVHDEAVIAFEEAFPLEGDEWKSFVVTPAVMQIIGQISNRALIGLPLCRNKAYIKLNIDFAVGVIIMSFVLTAVPNFLRSTVNWLVSPIPGRVKEVTAYVQPVIDARRAEKKRLGDAYAPPIDMLTWLMDTAQEHKRGDRDIILRMMSTNFGSIHTTSMAFTHALYSLLSRPQYIEPLRAEAEHCIREHGWTKEAIDEMRFIDGFIKESQRVDIIGIIIGNRIAIQDTTMSDVFIPKGTMLTANVVEAHSNTAAWGSDAAEFDPYRFIKMEKETGRKIGIVSTSANSLSFGHGRHACPGRFFAAQELKLLLAHLLLNYDVKLDNKDQERPKNVWFGMSCMPNPQAKILLKKRQKN